MLLRRWALLSDEELSDQRRASVETLVVGGEVLTPQQVARWRAGLGKRNEDRQRVRADRNGRRLQRALGAADAR